MDYVREYIDKIKSGEIITSKRVKQFYFDHIEPVINDEHEKYYYDPEEGNKFIHFVENYCRQSKGKWTGKLIELMLFQKAKYQAIFGIFNRETGYRRFQEIFDVRARKNGKSTENAALANYQTYMEDGAEVYAAATVAAQARRIWDESVSMIEQDDALKEIFKYKQNPSPVIYTEFSIYKYLSKNVKSFDSFNVSTAVIDEVHELAREIYDLLIQGTGSRDQYLISMISTSGFVREGLFDDMYHYAIAVIEGIHEDDSFFPLLYELDDEKEIEDENMWIKANPGLGVIKNVESLRKNVSKMKQDHNFVATVKTKDFNIVGLQNKMWLSKEQLLNTEVYSDEQLRKFDNTIVLGGFDLSRTQDITAFTTLLFDQEAKKIIAISMFWITKDFYQHQIESHSKIPWAAWVDRGLIRISGTNLIDYHDVAYYVNANFRKYGWMYQYINYDSYSAQYLIEELNNLGYSKKHCLKATIQGYKTLSIPMQLLYSHLKEKVLVYQNNPVYKWMLSNVELVKDRNNNWMPKKAGDKRERKIDGVATTLNAYVSLSQNIDYYLGS